MGGWVLFLEAGRGRCASLGQRRSFRTHVRTARAAGRRPEGQANEGCGRRAGIEIKNVRRGSAGPCHLPPAPPTHVVQLFDGQRAQRLDGRPFAALCAGGGDAGGSASRAKPKKKLADHHAHALTPSTLVPTRAAPHVSHLFGAGRGGGGAGGGGREKGVSDRETVIRDLRDLLPTRARAGGALVGPRPGPQPSERGDAVRGEHGPRRHARAWYTRGVHHRQAPPPTALTEPQSRRR